MSTHKHFDKICVVVLALTLLLTVLFMNGQKLGIEVVVDEDDEAHSGAVYFTANDPNGDWARSGAAVITLSGETASVSGSGAYAYGGDVVISSAGLYVLSGTLSNGSIIVDAYNNSKVWLLFDGVDLSCQDDACLRVEQADKVFLTLAEGSENVLNGPVIFSAAAEADGRDGVVYAHDDLTINGSGSLAVNAWYLHGIVAKDDLVITGGTIAVHAQADGIRANDSLRLCGASVTVEAGDDGVAVSGSSSLPAAADNGYLYIESGSLSVSCEDDALKAAGALEIRGGELTLAPVGDAIRSDTSVSISGGRVAIDNCYEGIEAPLIALSGGETSIACRDDGLNASEILTGDAEPQVLISGGSLTVVNSTASDADGIDSNGDILITGGDVRVSLPGAGTNNALDYDSEGGGACAVSGGRVIACGSANMAGSFGSGSTQCAIVYTFGAARPAGTAVSLEDAAGQTLLAWEVPCSFTYLTLSAPELQVGESYTLRLGESAETLTLGDAVSAFGVQSAALGGMAAPGGDLGGGFDDDFDGDRPAPPDGGFGGERPAAPDGGFGGLTPPGAAGQSEAQTDTASAVTAAQWALVAAALLVLALGVLLGMKYEPKA